METPTDTEAKSGEDQEEEPEALEEPKAEKVKEEPEAESREPEAKDEPESEDASGSGERATDSGDEEEPKEEPTEEPESEDAEDSEDATVSVEEAPSEEEPEAESREPVAEEPKEEPKAKKPAKKKKAEVVDDSSLGLGPADYVQPQFEKPKIKEPIPEKDLSPLSTEEEAFGTTIFAVKTAIGHEKMVAERIVGRGKKRKLKVFSVLSPTKLRGYILLECINNRDAVKELIKGLEHVRNVVDGETTLGEIEHFLTPKPLVFGIMEGDIVEIIQGPFKGEKAKVQQIDESKEEITVELFEAMVSIPVTIRGDHVRVLEKEGA